MISGAITTGMEMKRRKRGVEINKKKTAEIYSCDMATFFLSLSVAFGNGNTHSIIEKRITQYPNMHWEHIANESCSI